MDVVAISIDLQLGEFYSHGAESSSLPDIRLMILSINSHFLFKAAVQGVPIFLRTIFPRSPVRSLALQLFHGTVFRTISIRR